VPVEDNIKIPGAPSIERPAVEEPTDVREPLPPKPDQQGPEAVSPTGSPTGAPETPVRSPAST
jgi:catalase